MKNRQRFLAFVLFIPILACTIAPTDITKPVRTPKTVYVVEIVANQGWQNTDVYLQSGQQVHIEYMSGQITDGTTSIFDGSGTDYTCGHSGCCEPMPAARRSSLIGRVGRINDEVFFVGNGGVVESNSAGVLLLRINDCDSGLSDNSGSFRVRIIP